MSKNLVIALFLGYITPSEAKIRPIVEQYFNESPKVEMTHERKVREHLVQRCSDTPMVMSGNPSEFIGHGPTVESHGGLSCQSLCIFKDDQNQWCFSTTSPMLTSGWNFNQYTGTDFWQVLVKPYLETQVEMNSTLRLQRFMQ